MGYAIGVDIGGTKTAIGIVDTDGNVVADKVVPTNQGITPEEMIGQMISIIQQLMESRSIPLSEVDGIGIGAPGPLDVTKGLIVSPPNLEGWHHVPIVDQFKQSFSVPIYFENDASAAALAEKWVGAAQQEKNFIYMTISTGIGAGIVIDGKLYTGATGNAGDIGHMVVDPGYGFCKCGQKGCFEWVASGTAIARQGTELMGYTIDAVEVFKLYENGEEKIVKMVDDVFERIGMGCVTLINALEPEKIVIGGGVSKVGDPLFTAINKYISQYALSPQGRKTKAIPSQLNGQTGMIGAAALVKFNESLS